MSDLRKDDPVYYKSTISALIKQARENGLQISIGETPSKITTLYFTADNGECAGVTLLDRRLS